MTRKVDEAFLVAAACKKEREGGEEQQQFGQRVGVGRAVEEDGAQAFAQRGASRFAPVAGGDAMGGAPRLDVGELGAFADAFAAIQGDEAPAHGLGCCCCLR